MGEIKEYRGIRGLVAAQLLKDTEDEILYGTPFPVAGTSELSKKTTTSSDAHYYDNIPAVVIDSTGKDEVGINVSAVPLDVLAKITGQYYDEDTGMFVEGERDSKYFAIGYITERTDGTEVFVWRLKGKFSVPDDNHKSKDEGTDAEGQEITFTGINTAHKFEKNGKTAKAVNVEQDKNPQNEKEFFETVQTPDTVKGKITPAA